MVDRHAVLLREQPTVSFAIELLGTDWLHFPNREALLIVDREPNFVGVPSFQLVEKYTEVVALAGTSRAKHRDDVTFQLSCCHSVWQEHVALRTDWLLVNAMPARNEESPQ
ncbi:MAG: hypothetical protein MI757_09225 [Pirellulales bacterium]|nr:hypothetical protein [Pirellulales bacterium]